MAGDGGEIAEWDRDFDDPVLIRIAVVVQCADIGAGDSHSFSIPHLGPRLLRPVGAKIVDVAAQHVPLSQLTWTIILTKENLWEFLKSESVLDRPVEVFGELEMLQLLDQFFDRAIYYAAIGYERAVGNQPQKLSVAG